ncbi:MAG: isoprenylcysteine carboxylmethyltransferase family protein [Proteobacteria bacterium]|nr:isoprenylcysteine carboxylmethyltransferase family protein [Pseudomonadota bacterium]
MTALTTRSFVSAVSLFVAMALLLFVPPWTLDWWQAWLFLAVYFGGSLALMLDLAKRDPALLERRMKGGPWAEERLEQKIIMTLASLGFFALLLIPAFDRRFGWSHLPVIVVLAGNALMLIGGYGVWRVFCENSFTSARIELAADQRVISTGPYALVRHPMYTTALVMMIGIPLALGSLWGLLAIVAMVPALVWRMFDEERFLAAGLPGYAEYKQKVRYRLIPHVW